MLTSRPHLLTRRPSPTTAEFTVTTRPAQPTALQRLVLDGVIPLLRLALFLAGLLLLHGSWTSATSAPPLWPALADAPWYALAPLAAAALIAAAQRPHVEESLLVLRGLGVQTRSSGRSLLAGGGGTRFIPTRRVRDVLLNEAFRGHEVRYYLLVVVDGDDDVVVVFPRLLPGRDVVEAVWRGVRRCLYDEVPPGGEGGEDGKGG